MSDLNLFRVAFVATLVGLLLLAAWLGKEKDNPLHILVDARGRYSLNRLQLVVWTLLGLSAIVGLGLARLRGPGPALDFTIPAELLGLMGISVGTGVVAGAAKAAKDKAAASNVARAGTFVLSSGATREIVPRLAQIFLEEEGDGADVVVNVAKFQAFALTVLLATVYLVSLLTSTTQAGLPPLSEKLVWLAGISHAGYVGDKLPAKK